MFEINLDATALNKRMNEMIAKINHFKRVDIGQELSDWQTEDLHRHRPFTMRSRAKGRATTKIRPHSLYEMKQSVRYQRKEARLVSRGTRRSFYHLTHWQVKTSTRPILRKAEEDVLVQRMNDLMRDKLVW